LAVETSQSVAVPHQTGGREMSDWIRIAIAMLVVFGGAYVVERLASSRSTRYLSPLVIGVGILMLAAALVAVIQY
jgi:hypothetical protein